MCQWFFCLISFCWYRLESAVLTVEILEIDVRWCQKKKMWAYAFLADILHVRCCNRTKWSGPKGLDQRGISVEYFFVVGYFMFFTLLSLKSICACML